jgi:hypothetical protein
MAAARINSVVPRMGFSFGLPGATSPIISWYVSRWKSHHQPQDEPRADILPRPLDVGLVLQSAQRQLNIAAGQRQPTPS